MRLSLVQQNVLDLMRQGWVLKSGQGYSPGSPWLSKVVKRQLIIKTVSSATIWRLYKLGLIDCVRQFPITTWKLLAKDRE